MKCSKCGQDLPSYATICEHCGATVTPEVTKPAKPENVFTGTIGAILGAIIGIAVIILFSRLGKIAAVSGVILAAATVKGYELLGNQITKKGVVISLLLILAAPYLADRLDWAIVVIRDVEDITFAEAFANIHHYVDMGYIDGAEYTWNLLKLYFFTLLGIAGALIPSKKK